MTFAALMRESLATVLEDLADGARVVTVTHDLSPLSSLLRLDHSCDVQVLPLFVVRCSLSVCLY
jgi:hypothetical protein